MTHPAADEPAALEQPKRHFTKVSSLPLLGLKYFHECLDRYSAKEQTRKGFSLPTSKTAFPYLSIDGKAVE